LRFGTTSLNSENPFNADSIILLAPDIVEAILDGRRPAETLAVLMRPFAVGWWGACAGRPAESRR
jgi:hypothetical protein